MSRDEPLRVTVHGPENLVVELAPAEVPGTEAGDGAERVIRLPKTAEDRGAGVRRFEALIGGWRFEVTTEPARRAALRERAARAGLEHRPATGMSLRAQIPGRVVRVWVSESEVVEQGQRLLAVEAMKMENEIRAPHAGRVEGLRVELGQLVERNDELLTIS